MSMISAKRRETEVFSLAFLDCICCGFGAVILVFILTITQKTTIDNENVADVAARVKRLEHDVSVSQEEVDRIAQALAAKQVEVEDINAKNNQDQLKLTDRQKELLLLLQQTGNLKDALSTLLGEKKLLPTDDHSPLPIPNVDRRQYLTGVKLRGDYILFMVRISGSMMDDTIDSAAARLDDTDAKKREAPKWVRTLHALEWMIASLDPKTHFQIQFFNDETTPVLPTRSEEWFTIEDKQALKEIIAKLHTVVPQGGANLERAFTTIRYMKHLPDSVVLFTDGLPTLSDSIPTDGPVDQGQRHQFFNAAIRQLPQHIPVSTILMPLNGDPAAAADYWLLANASKGALVSPAKNWPET
ncbi:MAG TPA: hypothetical protein VG838_10175 [Opitutaceae bacterium]|nr:hypothetical protein [Opitutaceae bacterium]